MLRLVGRNRRALAGAQVHDRRGDDDVRVDLDAGVGLVLAAAQFAFDADVSALLESRCILGQLGPSLDTVPFHAFLAFIAIHPRRLGRNGEGGDGLAVRGIGGLGFAAEEADEFYAIDYLELSRVFVAPPEV